MIDLTGKVALITGGGSGIGYGIAEQMLKSGGKVVITGRTEERLENARKRLGERCYAYVNDVTDKASHAQLLSDIEKEVGPVSILVNNAGEHLKKPSIEIRDNEFSQVLDTNVESVFALTREALKYMLPRKNGSVIFISSMTALYGLPRVVAYSTSKSALLGMMYSFTTEYSGQGVRFNCIAPGFIESKMFLAAMKKDPERRRRIMERTPAGRLGTPSDVGKAAAFLASDAADFITGVCLPVDGGNSVGF